MRKGSKGVKNKNLKKINDKPLLSYTIEQALNSKLFDNVVISTDSKMKSNASFIVMLNLVIFSSVIEIFSFDLILFIKNGTTEPLLPKTFPYLNAINLVLC